MWYLHSVLYMTHQFAFVYLYYFQVIGVDRAAGTVKVSRKALLEASDASADDIAAIAPDSSEVSLESAPTFPVIPPRKFSQDYFL